MTVVGEYKGFSISVGFNPMTARYYADLIGETAHYVEFGEDNIKRMDNALEKIESHCQQKIVLLSEVETQIADAEMQIGVPFAKADELKAKSSRLAQLNAELDVDGKKNDLGGLEQDDNPQTPKIKR